MTTTGKDPVCGMAVKPGSPHRHTFEGAEYLFCSAGCLKRFQDNPGSYLEPQTAAVKPAMRAGTLWVCPMDSEVQSEKPGSCPKCGMALEPEVPVAAHRTEWTCPMHPEIVRDEPGSCPICGMALERRVVSGNLE